MSLISPSPLRASVWLATVSAFLAVGFSARCPADTIVLKNGQTINAESVTESGDQIICEGVAGRISIPKSSVERIEKGGAAPDVDQQLATTPGTALQPSDLPELQLPPADLRPQDITRNGEVNEALLKQLASQAGQSQPQRQKAVSALLMAAVFEAKRQRLAEAGRWAEAAVGLSPADFQALLVAAEIDLARRQYREAIHHLLRAQAAAPSSADVLTLLADAYYFSEGASRAVLYWKQAEAIRPDPRLEARIQQAEEEAQIESGLQQISSYHFSLSWQGSPGDSGFGRGVLDLLEQQFRDLQAALDFTPGDAISVVLYSAVQFGEITQAPHWAGALNDGRIRVPVQGLTSVSAELARVLKHELTHSFVYQMSAGRCPTWLDEGMAELESGEQLGSAGPELAAAFAASQEMPFQQLEGSFEKFSQAQAQLAYAQSLAAVEWVRDEKGAYELPELLHAAGENAPEQALRSVVGVDYAELEQQLTAYLQQRYRP